MAADERNLEEKFLKKLVKKGIYAVIFKEKEIVLEN